MCRDPFGSNNQRLLRTDDDEAIDDRGNKYRLERKFQVEIHPFFIMLLTPVAIFLLVTTDGYINDERPESIQSNTSSLIQPYQRS